MTSSVALSAQSARDFVEFHDQIDTSSTLLDGLESFLSTFQNDLSSVSGQISELQDRSKDIENRLKARRKIEKPLFSLLSDLCIPPDLTVLILDSNVGEPWINAIWDFEQRLVNINARKRVKAAKDLAEVAEGLRIVAATKIRGFFLGLLAPIRTNMSTNIQVLQMAVMIKYKPLYDFLVRHASNVAQELQHAYVATVRVYYETGFRRYIRSLGWIKARTVEKPESIASSSSEVTALDEKRLAFAKLDGASVTLTYMADDKTYKEPVESLFRSMLLVLLDNATSEYAFINTFFSKSPQSGYLRPNTEAQFSPTQNNVGEWRPSGTIIMNAADAEPLQPTRDSNDSHEEQKKIKTIWQQIMDPSLTYCQTFTKSIIENPPPVISFLTMIRLTEDVLSEVQKRSCPPFESFVFGIRLDLWPAFQRLMTEHVQSLNKLVESTSGGYFSRGTVVSDTLVQIIASRYVIYFTAFVLLTDNDNETMIFSNLNRLRQELTQLIASQAKKISNPFESAKYQSLSFETIVQALNKGQIPPAHPSAKAEVAYWGEREEEARRRINSLKPSR